MHVTLHVTAKGAEPASIHHECEITKTNDHIEHDHSPMTHTSVFSNGRQAANHTNDHDCDGKKEKP
jgi:hypothetical protein